MEHKRRVERKREEKEIEAKKERVRKAREAAQKARKVRNTDHHITWRCISVILMAV